MLRGQYAFFDIILLYSSRLFFLTTKNAAAPITTTAAAATGSRSDAPRCAESSTTEPPFSSVNTMRLPSRV